jgi:hypothetical protein
MLEQTCGKHNLGRPSSAGMVRRAEEEHRKVAAFV